MDIVFNCPRCGRHLSVEERGAGLLVNCPSCKEQIEVPRSTGSQPPQVPVSATPPPLPPSFTPPPPPPLRPSLPRASLTVADHDRVPGLKRPVSLSEYAELEGLRLADVLAAIRQLKIPAAYFRWRWWVEAPPNSEARLAQLRANKHESIPQLISWLRERFAKQEHTQPTPEPQRERPQAPSEPQPSCLNENKHESERTLSQSTTV